MTDNCTTYWSSTPVMGMRLYVILKKLVFFPTLPKSITYFTEGSSTTNEFYEHHILRAEVGVLNKTYTYTYINR